MHDCEGVQLAMASIGCFIAVVKALKSAEWGRGVRFLGGMAT